jgi:ribosomal protein L2
VPDEQASEAASSLTRKFSFPGENARFCDPDREENDLFAAWKGIVSDWTRNAPLLHLNYRDTRTVMIQNAHGIATNDRKGCSGDKKLSLESPYKIGSCLLSFPHAA